MGVDRAAALLRRAQAKASTHQSQLTWVQGNLASLPLTSQSLEGALALLALDFIEARPGSPGTGPGGAPPQFSGGRGPKPLPF